MTDDEIDQLCKQPSSYPAIDSSDWKTLNAEKKAEQVEIELNKGKRAKECNGGKKNKQQKRRRTRKPGQEMEARTEEISQRTTPQKRKPSQTPTPTPSTSKKQKKPQKPNFPKTWQIYYNRKHSVKYHEAYDKLKKEGKPDEDAREGGRTYVKRFAAELKKRWGKNGKHWALKKAMNEKGWMGIGPYEEIH